jgi:hypothetical protein
VVGLPLKYERLSVLSIAREGMIAELDGSQHVFFRDYAADSYRSIFRSFFVVGLGFVLDEYFPIVPGDYLFVLNVEEVFKWGHS